MVKTNFTLKGEHVEVVANLKDGKPVFTLEILGEVVADDIEYDRLDCLATGVIKELEDLCKYWCGAGMELLAFHEAWAKKEESHEQAD